LRLILAASRCPQPLTICGWISIPTTFHPWAFARVWAQMPSLCPSCARGGAGLASLTICTHAQVVRVQAGTFYGLSRRSSRCVGAVAALPIPRLRMATPGGVASDREPHQALAA